MTSLSEKKRYIILLVIVLLALFLRLYRISSLPALNADEAAIGYNAYSLLVTGKDEHGHSWPIEFQSFNDYKPGGYFYLTLPFIKTLGLSEISVRLPNIILSILSVFLIYSLTNNLFASHASKSGINIGHLAALLLAISPWHLHFSRGGWETNAATSLLLCGLVIYIKRPRFPKSVLISTIFIVASMYTYHSMRLIAPIFLTMIHFREFSLKRNVKTSLSLILITMTMIAPLLYNVFANNATSRFSGVGVFADKGPIARAEELRLQHSSTRNILNRLIHNKYIEFSLRIADNYLRHFSVSFLFLEGDEIQRNKIPWMGLFYYFEIVTIGVGMISIAPKNEIEPKLLFLWVLIAPLASALTFQSPHALRAENMVIPLIIISANGLYRIFFLAPIHKLAKLSFFSLALWNFLYYFHQYHFHLAKQFPFSSQYGFRELSEYIKDQENKYDRIVITTHYDQPYILTLFYLKYDPSKFQSEHTLTPRDQYGFSTVNKFGKFEFDDVRWEELKDQKGTLLVATPSEVHGGIRAIKEIYFPNGNVAFKLISI